MPENAEGLEQQEAGSEETDTYDQQETEAVDTLEEADTEKPEEFTKRLETDFDSGEEDSAAGSDLDSALENIKEISADTEITIPAVQDPTMRDFFSLLLLPKVVFIMQKHLWGYMDRILSDRICLMDIMYMKLLVPFRAISHISKRDRNIR